MSAHVDRLEARWRRLEEEGALVRVPAGEVSTAPVVRRPGALARFLADREA